MSPALPARSAPVFLALVLAAFSAPACKGGAKPAPSRPAASAAPSAAPAPPLLVRLDVLPAKVGEKERSVRKSALTLGVEFWQDGQKIGSNDSRRAEEYSRESQVLALSGGSPAKLRVRYDHYHLTEAHPDKPPVDTTLLEGHTYTVDATESAVKATAESGKAVGKEEEDTLKKLHGDLGQDDPIVAALGTRPIPVGKTVPLRQVLFRALLSSTNGEFKSGTVVLSGTRREGERDLAVFDWSADMRTEEENGLEIVWHLKGQAVMGTSPARTIRTTVKGALDIEGHTRQNGARVDIAGDGTFQDDRTVSPL